MSFKKLIVGAALSISSLAAAAPHHPAVPFAPHPVVNSNGSDRFDVAQGRMLLRELDSPRYGSRMRGQLDARINAFITAELNESRHEARSENNRRERREEKQSTRQLTRLLSDFSRVHGRFDPSAMMEKRRVLVAAIDIAERDLRDGRRGDRYGRR
ncbi:MAG: hypothetical protein JNM17_01600 [Archangium sp.]|nr:hypothetical protein [Archangium sp.]